MPPQVIWRPTPEHAASSALAAFASRHGRAHDAYSDLWRWSVEQPADFWTAIWREFGVRGEPGPALPGPTTMPGTQWFPDARLNYAEHLLGHADDDAIALHHASELRAPGEWTWGDLRERVRLIRGGLVAKGVRPGDRVAAYLPNVPDTIAAFLATASLGAVWTVAAPEFGASSVIDRFAQLAPTVLLAVDGYRYGGKDFDRTDAAQEIASGTGARLVRFGHLDGTGWEPGFLTEATMAFERVPFDHPLWILFSSGTTGLPKAIVQGQGGILLEQLKTSHLHLDARSGDRVLWFTTTGWMMWNYLVGVLHTKAAVVLYDGSPVGDRLWDLCDHAEVTIFGTSAAFVTAAMKDGTRPTDGRRLCIRAVGSTGSPLPPEGFAWLSEQFGPQTWIFSMSGGTDVCTAFVGGVPTLPVHLGELQAPALGARLEAWDPAGHPVPEGTIGELVLTQPMPSMPLQLWGDDDGHLLHESYYDFYPGVWRHGDWIELTESGGAIIHGRSDATINRGGVRVGTSEIYRAVLGEDDVLDALVVDLPRLGGESRVCLFVVLRDDALLDDGLRRSLGRRIRHHCSPRHVPDDVVAVPAIPRTLSGKVIEVPVKRILMGEPPASAVSRASLANPEALDVLVACAAAVGLETKERS